MQSRLRRRRRSSPTTRAGGVNRLSFGVQSMRAHVLAALGRTHDPANVERAGRLGPRRRHSSAQPRPHLRHAGRAGRRLGGDARRRARARADARERLRPHGRSRYAARQVGGGWRARRARRRRPSRRSTRSPTTASPPPGWTGTRSRTGPGPGDECRHNLLYWRQGDYAGDRLRRPRPRRGAAAAWNVRTPERYIAAVECGRIARGGGRGPRTGRAGRRGAAAGDCAPRAGMSGRRDQARRLRIGRPFWSGRVCRRARGRRSARPASAIGWSLTRPGRLLANDVVARLLAARDHDRTQRSAPRASAGTR